MNARAMFAIVRKDLKVVSQNKGVTIPILMIVLIMFVVIPWVISYLPGFMESLAGSDNGSVQGMIKNIPPTLMKELAGLTEAQKSVIYILVYMLAPMFLVIPLMVSLVIAADSFAGEKERKTMEALLYTPTTDRDLFVGKLLSGWLAACAIAMIGFILYMVNVNAATWPIMHRIYFPNAMWLVLIFWTAPALPGLGLGVMVRISARAQGFQDAYQIGNVVVIPIILLLFVQVAGVLVFSATLVFLLGLIIWLLDIILIWMGSRSFRRGRLLAA